MLVILLFERLIDIREVLNDLSKRLNGERDDM